MENNPPKDQILPKPLTDLPLPEKQIPAHLASQGQTLQGHALQNKTKWLILLLVLVAVTLIGFAGGKYYLDQQKLKAINDFESCVASGNPIQESYPATCRTTDGRSFTQVLSEEEQKKLLPPDPTADWQTYTNNIYNFSFKYPREGKIEEFPPDAPAPAAILRIPNTSSDLLVHVYENFKTVNEAISYKLDSEEKNQIYPSKYSRTNYNNGVINGEKLISEINPNTMHNYIDVYSQFNNKIYHSEFRYDDSEDRKKMLLLADQILSTFKFTNQSISCTPRPSCLDTEPRCMIAETEDMCPPSPTPSI
ncbi:MAG: hypothetical protein KBD51_02800 [Candidatus Levybacteria bacterium]|nr:hypothetical protein [Candidatus Levybacteria bacterium]